MKTFTKKVRINRFKWRTGDDAPGLHTGEGTTSLLNEEGFMCCLGFAAKQIGKISNEKIRHYGEPDDIGTVISPLTEKNEAGFICNTKFTGDCIKVNDDTKITRKQRERKLIDKFNATGIDLEFFGTYTEPVEQDD